MNIPRIQIQQQYAKLGLDADLGQYSMRQPKATIEMETVLPRVEIEQRQGTLNIDQSRAWHALGVGGSLQMMDSIYSLARNVALEGIGRIAERGDRLAAIHTGANAIADIGQEEAFRFHEFNYMGPASVDNVDIRYEPGELVINAQQGRIDIRVTPNRPEVEYTRGKLDIYVEQYAKVTITPPHIDIQR
jgi:hypothetical protein